MIRIQTIPHYDCDVLVVGGGPGGSSLAAHLSKKGAKVIVLERKKFPRDKVCGDAVSPIALTELDALGITALDVFPTTNEITEATLFLDEERVAVIDLPKGENNAYHSRVIPRLQLDDWIHQAAKNAGATYLENTSLTNYSIKQNGVFAQIKQGTDISYLRAKAIVGADGSNSTVARILHGAKPLNKERLLALRAYFEGINGPAHRCDIFFKGDNFPGIYWVFPTGPHSANIGLGMVAETLPKSQAHAKDLLENHIKNNKRLSARIGDGTIKGKILGWPLTMYNPGSKIVSDRLILMGDAAGLINSLSGDGIQYALLSGRWASECLIECLNKNDFSCTALNHYKRKVADELGFDFALSNMLVQFARARTLNPVWMAIIRVLVDQAGVDKEYGSIIGGIFGGTYPSYKALYPSFLLKTVLQGGMYVGFNTKETILKGPNHWAQKGRDTGDFVLDVLQGIRQQPAGHAQWAVDVVREAWKVAGHIITELKDN